MKLRDKKILSLEAKLLKEQKLSGKLENSLDELKRDKSAFLAENLKLKKMVQGAKKRKANFFRKMKSSAMHQNGGQVDALRAELHAKSRELAEARSELDYLRQKTQAQSAELFTLKQEKIDLENMSETFSVNESKHLKLSLKKETIQQVQGAKMTEQMRENGEEIKCLKEFLLNVFYVLFSRYGKQMEATVDKDELFKEHFRELNFKYYKIFLKVING